MRLLPIIFNLYSKYLTTEAPDFKIRGKVIHTMKYAYYLVVFAKEVMVLQGYRA